MGFDAVRRLAEDAKSAAHELSLLPTGVKNAALKEMALAIRRDRVLILLANKADVDIAKKKGVAPSLIGRLELNDKKIEGIAASLENIASLPDPVDREIWTRKRPNGLRIRKVGVPLGLILIIYESRPNVTADCMALCLKSGNSVVLKGGSEALNSNRAIFDALRKAAVKKGVPVKAFALVPTADRAAVKELLQLSEVIDLVIPRGGEGLIREVARISKIPVIKHYKGVCHVYVDRDADLKKAVSIVINSKTQNPGVCNAMETLLVDQAVASKFLPVVASELRAKNVKLRGSDKVRQILPGIEKATEEDWHAEYLDLILAIKVVKDAKEAVAHIQKYGSHHSDAIVTKNKKTADFFSASVDSACVFINASTRFNDGGEFGMCAEMGISTDKLHARGPMGLEELTSYKYVVTGDGQVRG